MSVLAELVQVCGVAHVRPATPQDVPGGIPGGTVAAPADPAQVAAVLRLAADGGHTVALRGGGTKLDWGTPPSNVDIVVDTRRMSGLHRHHVDDRTATVGAGTALRDVNPVLAPSGQRFALDPASAAVGGTVGGVIATGETGPLRHFTGPVTNLVAEIAYVAADGAHRTVTGADVAPLCGSLGTLGVITAVTLRLHPRPPATVWVRRSVRHPAELYDLVMLLDTTPLSVAGIGADWPALDRSPFPRSTPQGRVGAQAQPAGPGALALQIDGTAAGAADRARTAVTLLGGDATAQPHPPRWWGRNPGHAGDVLVRLTAPPDALHAVGYTLRDLTVGAATLRGAMGAASAPGGMGTGTVLAAIPGDLPAARTIGIVETMRHTLLARGGTCTALSASAPVHAALRGSDPQVAEARARKLRFDPAGRLSPGRLPLTDAS